MKVCDCGFRTKSEKFDFCPRCGHKLEEKETDLLKLNLEYLESVRDELIQAEETIARIRGSEEYKRMKNYFSGLKYQKRIEETPKSENKYTIKWPEKEDK